MMRLHEKVIALFLLLFLSSCGAIQSTAETVQLEGNLAAIEHSGIQQPVPDHSVGQQTQTTAEGGCSQSTACNAGFFYQLFRMRKSFFGRCIEQCRLSATVRFYQQLGWQCGPCP
jgi:hypothetical protein